MFLELSSKIKNIESTVDHICHYKDDGTMSKTFFHRPLNIIVFSPIRDRTAIIKNIIDFSTQIKYNQAIFNSLKGEERRISIREEGGGEFVIDYNDVKNDIFGIYYKTHTKFCLGIAINGLSNVLTSNLLNVILNVPSSTFNRDRFFETIQHVFNNRNKILNNQKREEKKAKSEEEEEEEEKIMFPKIQQLNETLFDEERQRTTPEDSEGDMAHGNPSTRSKLLINTMLKSL